MRQDHTQEGEADTDPGPTPRGLTRQAHCQPTSSGGAATWPRTTPGESLPGANEVTQVCTDTTDSLQSQVLMFTRTYKEVQRLYPHQPLAKDL